MNVTIIDAKDNVAVAIEPIAKGDRLEARGADLGVTAKSDITIYHKVAIRDIPKGEFWRNTTCRVTLDDKNQYLTHHDPYTCPGSRYFKFAQHCF